jgi:hypothetical protein
MTSYVEAEFTRWLDEHPQVKVVLPDRPEGDWRSEEGYGWIFKVWFQTWSQSWAARNALREAGWDAKYWGRKVRVTPSDGYDGEKLTEFVLSRWPKVRQIQLRCD